MYKKPRECVRDGMGRGEKSSWWEGRHLNMGEELLPLELCKVRRVREMTGWCRQSKAGGTGCQTFVFDALALCPAR